MILNSMQNPIVKELLKLHSTKGRKELKRFLAEGIRTVSTIAESMTPIKLFATEAALPLLKEFDQNSITVVTVAVMKKISQSKTPSGIVGLFAMPEQPALNDLSEGIVLYEVNDPGNVGTLLRTTVAMNKKTAVFIGGVDPYNFKVVQASAGVIAQLNIFQTDWHTLFNNKKNLSLVALVVSGGQSADKINFSDILFVIGNEAHGLPTSIANQSNYQMTLSMPGKTESLNAAVAGSIALYLAWHS